MVPWYERIAARLGLRVAGLVLLLSAWPEARALSHHVRAPALHGMTAIEFALGVLLFCSATMGAALLTVGARLWKPVRLSSRWTAAGSSSRKDDQAGVSASSAISKA